MSQPAPSGGDDGSGDISSELESFRQQWRAEVKAKTTPSGASGNNNNNRNTSSTGPSKAKSTKNTKATGPSEADVTAPSRQQPAQGSSQRPSGARRGSSTAGALQTPLKLLSSGKKLFAQENDDDYAPPRAFDDVAHDSKTAQTASASATEVKQEPESALEHYEKAVEKEALGSLGDSLRHYRTAFRVSGSPSRSILSGVAY